METKANLEPINTLAMGVTSEQMEALYFNAAALHEPNYRLSQLNARGNRFYYTWDAEGNPVFFPSVTTILHNVMPENKYLTEWKLSLGKEESLAYTMERANYGSFIHGMLANLMINRKFALESVRGELKKYAERENLPAGFVDAHEEEAKADIVAFAKWMMDYDVRPYAVEVALYSPEYSYAGMIDCVCNMRAFSKEDEAKDRAKAGDDAKKLAKIEEKYSSRLDAIVDFKSGKKGFYDEYAIQLELYRRMWNENFPDKPIERIFNIAPKDYLKTVNKRPSYSFEEQTENPVLKRIPYLLGMYEIMDESAPRNVTIVSGNIDLDNNYYGNVDTYSLAELVKIHHDERDEDDGADPFENLGE